MAIIMSSRPIYEGIWEIKTMARLDVITGCRNYLKDKTSLYGDRGPNIIKGQKESKVITDI